MVAMSDELSERAQERRFTCSFLCDEIQHLSQSYIEFRDAYIEKGDYASAMDCNSKSEAFKTAAHCIRSFGCIE
jgi:hypothetical protein